MKNYSVYFLDFLCLDGNIDLFRVTQVYLFKEQEGVSLEWTLSS